MPTNQLNATCLLLKGITVHKMKLHVNFTGLLSLLTPESLHKVSKLISLLTVCTSFVHKALQTLQWFFFVVMR